MGRVTREKGYVHEGGRAPFHNSEAEAPPLTAAEKRKATGAANLAREEADNNAHQEATLGKVRRSKATALEKKVWETSKAPVSNANGARKRTASSAKEPEGVKIVKPATTSDPEKPPKKSSSGSKLQAAQVENGDLDPGEKTEQRRGAVNAKRRYAPAIVVDSDEDEALEALPPSPKPRLKPSKPATMSAASKTTRKTSKGADISEDEAAQAKLSSPTQHQTAANASADHEHIRSRSPAAIAKNVSPPPPMPVRMAFSTLRRKSKRKIVCQLVSSARKSLALARPRLHPRPSLLKRIHPASLYPLLPSTHDPCHRKKTTLFEPSDDALITAAKPPRPPHRSPRWPSPQARRVLVAVWCVRAVATRAAHPAADLERPQFGVERELVGALVAWDPTQLFPTHHTTVAPARSYTPTPSSLASTHLALARIHPMPHAPPLAVPAEQHLNCLGLPSYSRTVVPVSVPTPNPITITHGVLAALRSTLLASARPLARIHVCPSASTSPPTLARIRARLQLSSFSRRVSWGAGLRDLLYVHAASYTPIVAPQLSFDTRALVPSPRRPEPHSRCTTCTLPSHDCPPSAYGATACRAHVPSRTSAPAHRLHHRILVGVDGSGSGTRYLCRALAAGYLGEIQPACAAMHQEKPLS
ncbi:hypothetical protein B0H10DRAFT_2440215 [Mycena sp. CBHHK59/15]|nr:hypothetical protein B0H10DRAFT_2440215 [Mycena sp. CBHHK59/15]